VLQEVAAARHILIKCGSAEIDGYAFGMALDARSFDSVYKAFPELQTIRPVTYLIKEAVLRPKTIPRSSGRFSLNMRPLGELIDMYHTHGATKRHDKIFALLGMSRDNPGVSGLSLNYAVPWETLFEQSIKLLLSSQVSVEVRAEMTAVIESKGCILGKVSSVERESRDDRQQVSIIFKDASGYLRRERKWTLQPSAKFVQAGDLVSLLRGASTPTIIRPHKDHFSVVMIAAPLKDIGAEDGSIGQPEEPIFFPHDFLLVWNWGTQYSNEDIGHSDKRIRLRNVALILEDAEEYEKADESFRDTVKIYERGPGEEDPYTRTSEEKREMKQWEKTRMKLLLDQRGYEVPIAESVVATTAKNEKSGEVVMRLLFEQRGDEVPVTERVAIAAAGNEKSGEAMVRLLFEQRGDGVPITESVAAAVAKNEKGGEALMRLLLEQRGDGVPITESVAAAAAKNEKSGEAVMRLLFEQRGDKIPITENVAVAAARNEKSSEAVLGLLLKQREDKPQIKNTVLWASAEGYEAVVRLLLEKGADLETKDEDGQTPLIWAARNGHEAVARLLLEKGAVLDAKNEDGRTPLMLTAQNGHEAVARLLLEKGADLEAKNVNGWTPLMWTALHGREAVARLLLEKGAVLDAKHEYGWTLLTLAAEYGHEAVARLLLEKGADLEMKNGNGQTPLTVAAENGQEAIARLLLKKGAGLETKNTRGRTPLMLAVQYRHEAVARLLRENGGKE
jgi:ankyrin repeat protein